MLDVVADRGGANVTQVESSRLTPLLVALSAFALLVAGTALGMAFSALDNYSRDYKELERETRLQQMKLDEFRMALITAGIEPNPHAKGESK